MNVNPKISIVIPSFNQGKYIEQTICSIIEQGYRNVELIVIDAGSSDETVAIIRKYESYIAYWVSEPDCGQSHAINKGLGKCTGEIFNWINSDDFLEPNSLEKIADVFVNSPKVNVVCGYTRCFFDEDDTTSHEYRMGVNQTVASTLINVEMNQPGTFYRTDIVRVLGGVNESLRYVFDDELWFRYLCKYGLKNIVLSNVRFAQFRLHGSSKSVGEGFDFFNKEIATLHFDILKSIAAPSWLLKVMQENEAQAASYLSQQRWDVGCLERELYVAAFAAKYINTLYINGDKRNAKEAMQLVIENGYFKWNKIMTSLRLKLLFV
jgi:glycosyltransferase involved in cell wall biosynthesis